MADWLRGLDLNQRPLGYEPNELPDCSTPLFDTNNPARKGQTEAVCVDAHRPETGAGTAATGSVNFEAWSVEKKTRCVAAW